MNFFLKAIGYAALLSLPGHWLAPAYQALLVGATAAALGTPLSVPAASSVDLSAANLLTIYVALCLASGFASWRRRLVAIAIGIPLLVAVECLSGAAGLTYGSMLLRTDRAPGWINSMQQLLELARWLAVPLVWVGTLGRAALSRAEVGAPRSSSGPPPRAHLPADIAR